MIEDLKADSARWDSERRAQSSRSTSGGTYASRDALGVPRHSSNSPIVQYRYSETHQSRQHNGPTDGNPSADYGSRDSGYDPGPRYPGTGSHGYTGASGGASYGTQSYPSGGAPGYGYQQQPQQNPAQDHRFASPAHPGQMINPAFQAQQDPSQQYVSVASQHARNQNYPSDPYGNARMPVTGPPPQPTYATAAPSQPSYPAAAPSNYGYGQGPPPPGNAYPGAQSQDSFYGRGAFKDKVASTNSLLTKPTASPGHPAQSHPQGYVPDNQMTDVSNSRPRPTTSPLAAPMSSGSSGRHGNRETDRHSTDRHSRPPPRR